MADVSRKVLREHYTRVSEAMAKLELYAEDKADVVDEEVVLGIYLQVKRDMGLLLQELSKALDD